MGAWITYWQNVAQDAAEVMQRASGEVAAREYSATRLLSDVLGTWADGIEGLWSAFLASSSAPVPTVLLRVARGATEVKTDAVPVVAPGSADPECTDLVLLGGAAGKKIPQANVRVELTAGRDALNVRLTDLRRLQLADGHYQGLVFIEQRALAAIHVLVAPVKPAA